MYPAQLDRISQGEGDLTLTATKNPNISSKDLVQEKTIVFLDPSIPGGGQSGRTFVRQGTVPVSFLPSSKKEAIKHTSTVGKELPRILRSLGMPTTGAYELKGQCKVHLLSLDQKFIAPQDNLCKWFAYSDHERAMVLNAESSSRPKVAVLWVKDSAPIIQLTSDSGLILRLFRVDDSIDELGKLYDLMNGVLTERLTPHERYTSVALRPFSVKGCHLVSQSPDRSKAVWQTVDFSLATGEPEVVAPLVERLDERCFNGTTGRWAGALIEKRNGRRFGKAVAGFYLGEDCWHVQTNRQQKRPQLRL